MDIFIIDDDAEDTEMFCHALNEVAPHVRYQVSNTPKDALEIIRTLRLKPDFIFLDANMFIIDGKTCLQQLRAMEWLENTEIVMYSGYISDRQVEEMKLLGANQYLHKPSTYEELCRLLRSLFSK